MAASSCPPRFEFVVSTENNHYLEWQAMLFHYSCLRHQGQAPIVMVHVDEGQPLLDGFRRIVDHGGQVQTAPNLRRVNGVNYPPRNTSASLKYVETDADYIVLCDCDMIFLQPCPLARLTLGPRQVSFDELQYLQPDSEPFQPRLDETCRRAGVEPERLRESPMSGGVPHVIPRTLQLELAEDWLYCLDLFPTFGPWDRAVSGVAATECHVGPQREWLASMWGIVFAMHRLKLQAVMSRLCVFNHAGPTPCPDIQPGGPCLIHYCYGDERFNKRSYESADAAERGVWNVAPPPTPNDDTVHDELRRQLCAARDFYGIAKI